MSLLLVSSLGLGGCLTLDPTVTANTANSTVFEGFSTTEPWVSGRIVTTVDLAPNATTTGDVTTLAVIAEDGSKFDATTVAGGQTSATVYLPANQNATVVALDSINGTVVDTQPVTTGGNKLF